MKGVGRVLGAPPPGFKEPIVHSSLLPLSPLTPHSLLPLSLLTPHSLLPLSLLTPHSLLPLSLLTPHSLQKSALVLLAGTPPERNTPQPDLPSRIYCPCLLPFIPISFSGERLGIVGRNGAGKSTLLNLIAGTSAPTGGVREVGETTVFGYFTQFPPEIPADMRVINYIKVRGRGNPARFSLIQLDSAQLSYAFRGGGPASLAASGGEHSFARHRI